MQINHSNNPKNGAFFIGENGSRLAEMTYVWSGENTFIIDHTEVSETLKGQGVGKKLLMEVVTFARKGGYRIMPLCPFAKKMFDTIPEIKDVLL